RAAELVHAGAEAAGLAEMRREMEGAATNPPGIVYLVGAGPGAGDLLTLRAHRLLGEADVILHDRLVGDEVLDLARRDADRVAVEQGQESDALLVRLAREGKRVVRLTRGDPLGGPPEEIEALSAAGVISEIVPGVAAAVRAIRG
ncbi:MAG TPA: SAM-dependent methyltransferase, partial [Acetobacteraceae bacterium]|nr:SAM-dependent methyltransferase [Acetobacteraceae bacterium]